MWEYIFSILSLIIAYFLSSCFDILDFFSRFLKFITKDKKIEINVLIYVGMVDFIIRFIIDIINKNFKTNLSVVAFKKNEEINENSIPIIELNKTGVTEIKLKFELKGNAKNLRVLLDLPNWIQPQANVLKENGSYVYDVKELFGLTKNKTEKKISLKFDFPMIIYGEEGIEREFEVGIRLDRKKLFLNSFFCTFKSNSFKIKT